jgi:hypothetical protein
MLTRNGERIGPGQDDVAGFGVPGAWKIGIDMAKSVRPSVEPARLSLAGVEASPGAAVLYRAEAVRRARPPGGPAIGADAAPDATAVHPAAHRLINSIRAHLAEFGIVAGIGRNGVEALLEVIAKGEDGIVPAEARACLLALAAQFELVKQQILEMDRRVLAWHRSSSLSRNLEAIPGAAAF